MLELVLLFDFRAGRCVRQADGAFRLIHQPLAPRPAAGADSATASAPARSDGIAQSRRPPSSAYHRRHPGR